MRLEETTRPSQLLLLLGPSPTSEFSQGFGDHFAMLQSCAAGRTPCPGPGSSRAGTGDTSPSPGTSSDRTGSRVCSHAGAHIAAWIIHSKRALMRAGFHSSCLICPGSLFVTRLRSRAWLPGASAFGTCIKKKRFCLNSSKSK